MDEYYQAVRALPAWLAAPLAQLPAQTAARVQELRLRTGCAVTFTVQGRQCSASALPGCPPTLAAMRLDTLQIEEIFHTLCNGSVHTHERELSEGYLTTAAGNRVGVAGQFVQREGHGITLQKVTSLNLRIARSRTIRLLSALDKLLEQQSPRCPDGAAYAGTTGDPAGRAGQSGGNDGTGTGLFQRGGLYCQHPCAGRCTGTMPSAGTGIAATRDAAAAGRPCRAGDAGLHPGSVRRMSDLLRGFGLFLLPLCGWLAGDAVQAKTAQHLAALQRTIELLQRIRQEIQYRRADLQSLYRQLCHEDLVPQTPGAPVLQSAFAVSAAQRLHRNANGLATIRRGSRTIYNRHAAQHSGRPVCRTVWDWQAA